jgi:hypothetical protein
MFVNEILAFENFYNQLMLRIQQKENKFHRSNII